MYRNSKIKMKKEKHISKITNEESKTNKELAEHLEYKWREREETQKEIIKEERKRIYYEIRKKVYAFNEEENSGCVDWKDVILIINNN